MNIAAWIRVVLGGLALVLAGRIEADVGTPTARPLVDRGYGKNPPYNQFEGIEPHGQDQNKWLTRLMECNPKVQERGWIRVGSPQVYSRQLVYRDRAEEIQFLSDRLKTTREFHLKYQGVVDARFYEALAVQLAANFDPGSGKILDQQQKNLLQTAQQQGAVSGLQNEINLLNLRQQLVTTTNLLNKLEKEQATTGATQTPATQQDPVTAQQVKDLQSQIQSLQQQINNLSTPVVGSQGNIMKPAADPTGGGKPPSTVLGTGGAGASTADKAGLTGIEEEKSILEVRRFLQNERRRLTFDDMHDASGSITMELGMLVTLVPPKGKDAYALLEISVEKPDGRDNQDYNYGLLLQRWADYMAPAIQAERDLLTVRYANGMMPPNEKLMQVADAMVTQNTKEGAPADNRESLKTLRVNPSGLTDLNQTLRENSLLPSLPNGGKTHGWQAIPHLLDSLNKSFTHPNSAINDMAMPGVPAAAGGTRTIKPELMKKYLSLYYGEDFMKAFETYQKSSINEIPAAVKHMCFRFLNWTDRGVKVLAVDPAEQAQNISMLGATQSVRDTVLSLNAMLSGGVKGSARSDFYRDSQLYMQSVNRKPLAVGFVNGALSEPSFGWVLGPRFEVAMKRRWYQLGFLGEPRPTQGFSHEPTAHQVQVVISLPTWIPRLMLKVKAHWIDSKTGLPLGPINTPHVVSDDYQIPFPNYHTQSDCAARIPVSLEPDYAALTEGLLDYLHGKRRPPRIFLQDANERFILSTSDAKTHHLVLLGKDLWRTPAVYLDSMPAASVEVMPGLAGVVATFDALPPSDDNFYNVTVSTTGGFDSIPNIVMAPGGKSSAPGTPDAPVLPQISLGVRQMTHDYSAAIAEPANALSIPLSIVKNPYPVIPPERYLVASLGSPGVGALAAITVANNGLMAKPKAATALVSQIDGLTSAAPAANAVKLLCNVTMAPVQDPGTQDTVYRNVLVGDREIVLFKNEDAKKFLIKATTSPVGEYDLSKSKIVELTPPERVPEDYLLYAFPDYATALRKGRLKLRITPTAGTAAPLDLDPVPTGNLNFQLPDVPKATALYGLKKGSTKAVLKGELIDPATPDKVKFQLSSNLTLSIPEPP